MSLQNDVSRPTPQVDGFKISHTILKAGAGAGKTTSMIRLFHETAKNFRREEGRYPRIVLTTFTRKATQEIRERLLAQALKAEDAELFRYINSKSRVQISTIHGVLSLFLMQYGREVGLAPDFQMLDQAESYYRNKRLLRNLLRSRPEWMELLESYEIQHLLSMLSDYYEASFLFDDSLRAISLSELNEKVQRKILEITQKGREIHKSLAGLDLSDSWKNYLAQFDFFNQSFLSAPEGLRDFFDSLGRKPPFSSKKPPFDESLHQELEKFLKESKALLAQDGFDRGFNERHEDLAQKFFSLAQAFCEQSLKERLESSRLSMSDIEGLALHLIKQAPWAAEKFSRQWDFWMIDEYQDTSPLQVELLRHLVGAAPHFVVGDPQQSIYLFRGAQADVFHSKVQEIEEKNGQVQTALTNYRSRAPLLAFINSYFSQRPAFSAMLAARQEGLKEICSDVVIVSSDEDVENSDKRAILSLIQEKLAAGARPQEICVLARTNRVLQALAQEAFRFNIPVQVHSASGFSRRREVLDFLSFLKFLINPHDNLNLLTLLRSPWFHLDDQRLVLLLEGKRKNISIWTYWNHEKKSEGAELLNLLRSFQERAETFGLLEVLQGFLLERGLIDSSLKLDPSGRHEANLWKILMDYTAAEKKPGFSALGFIQDLTETLPAEDEADATPVVEPDRVNLMTIHASKGLQFKHVILAEFHGESKKYHGDWWMLDETTGRWTLSLRSEDHRKVCSLFGLELIKTRQQREAEESERLLYVAMTRARDTLSFVWLASPRKGSWAYDFPFACTDGLHEGAEYTYRVRTTISDPVIDFKKID